MAISPLIINGVDISVIRTFWRISMTTEDVKKNFSGVSIDTDQAERIDVVISFYQDIAINLNSLLADGRLKSIAMTKLEESCMFAIKAISYK
jgi:hypothetical protein